jgi:hypothetical protein
MRMLIKLSIKQNAETARAIRAKTYSQTSPPREAVLMMLPSYQQTTKIPLLILEKWV